MKKILNNLKRIGIDTNIFIYYFDSDSFFYPSANKLLTSIIEKKTKIVISTISLVELLSFKAPQKFIDQLEDELTTIPNLEISDVTISIAKEAAGIRRSYGFRLADSIQLATAIKEKADVFITNDQRLRQFKPLKVFSIPQI